MDLGLSGKLALVTGASRGIGNACVHSLVREGARVAMVARDPDRLRAAAAAISAPSGAVIWAAADLTQAAATQEAYRRIVDEGGVPDVVICAAGSARQAAVDELGESVWREAWEAKFLAVMNMVDAARPDMVKRGNGVIVNIIGVGGKIAAKPHLSGGAANSALMLATVGLGVALGPQGVRVVGLSPAATVTDRYYEGRRAYARILNMSEEELEKQNAATFPLGRPARAEEVADVAVFLASARASYMTGVVVQADGGCAPAI